MKNFFKGLIRETIYLVSALIVFALFLIISIFTIFAKKEFTFLEYLNLFIHFIFIYIIFQLFIYLFKKINKKEEINKKNKSKDKDNKEYKKEINKIYLLILSFLILVTYICSSYINIINPIKYVADIFINTLLFKTFPYIQYLILIAILAFILLIIKLVYLIKNKIKKRVNNKKVKTDKKENKEEKEKVSKEKKIEIKKTNKKNKIDILKSKKYVLLVIFLIILSIGMIFKIYRLNTIYIINLDNNNLILSEIVEAYSDISSVRILDLSKIDKDKQKDIIYKKLIFNESETYIVIPNDYLLDMKISKENKKQANKKLIYISNKTEDRNIEYKVLINKIRELAIIYEQYSNFTEIKEIIDKDLIKNMVEIKTK